MCPLLQVINEYKGISKPNNHKLRSEDYVSDFLGDCVAYIGLKPTAFQDGVAMFSSKVLLPYLMQWNATDEQLRKIMMDIIYRSGKY